MNFLEHENLLVVLFYFFFFFPSVKRKAWSGFGIFKNTFSKFPASFQGRGEGGGFSGDIGIWYED